MIKPNNSDRTGRIVLGVMAGTIGGGILGSRIWGLTGGIVCGVLFTAVNVFAQWRASNEK